MSKNIRDYEAIVMGASAGGLAAISAILGKLPQEYGKPIVLVQHRAKDSMNLFEDVLQQKCVLKVKQADEKERIQAGFVYVAPPDYHLLVENDKTFSLSSDAAVQFSRPSIDVLFQSAAHAYRHKLVGIILTGSNNDGAAGIAEVSRMGGFAIAQDPGEAQYPFMSQAAIETGRVHCVLRLKVIGDFLNGSTLSDMFSTA